jgi:putative SOS response-associated peptidase YedK
VQTSKKINAMLAQRDDAVSDLLKPYDARLMRSYPVSTRVNHVANDGAECCTPVKEAESQGLLFL